MIRYTKGRLEELAREKVDRENEYMPDGHHYELSHWSIHLNRGYIDLTVYVKGKSPLGDRAFVVPLP